MNTNKTLTGIFKLDHNIKIYIPSTVSVNQTADNTGLINETLKIFSGYFGGSTSYEAKGAWLSSVKGLVVENITIVESYATKEQVNENLESVLKHALKIKHDLKQEAVSLEYDNELYLV